jgi:hypothetical protein
LWVGYIINYDYTFTLGGLDTVSVNCADFSYQLGQTFLAEWNVDEELSSVRFDNLLDLPEVAYTGTRDIETGTVTLGGSAAYTVDNGTSVAAYADKINEAEQGRIFVNREGTITFQKRIGTTLGVPAPSSTTTERTSATAQSISPSWRTQWSIVHRCNTLGQHRQRSQKTSPAKPPT